MCEWLGFAGAADKGEKTVLEEGKETAAAADVGRKDLSLSSWDVLTPATGNTAGKTAACQASGQKGPEAQALDGLDLEGGALDFDDLLGGLLF